MDAETRARNARLASLKGTAAWEDLEKILAEATEKYWNRHLKETQRGKAIDQREIDRARGKLDGIRAILRAPEKAASIMEREETGDEAA